MHEIIVSNDAELTSSRLQIVFGVAKASNAAIQRSYSSDCCGLFSALISRG